MNTRQVRMEFAPPPTPGLVRALGLAIVAHVLLVAMLTMGVQWKHEATPITVEAELWSALPVQAAPPAPAPVPLAVPTPTPVPVPVPPEPVKPAAPKISVAPPAPPLPGPDPDIVIAQEKARLKKERQLQQDRLEHEKLQKAELKAQKIKEEKDAHDKELREKLARDKKLQQDHQRAQAAQAAQTAAETKKMAEIRQQQMERINRLAGQTSGNGSAGSTGTAKQASGPSASYGGRIVARIKPNITYTETIVGNPEAEVEVRTSPDGTIISRKLVKSSGVKYWDEAVLKAIDKTETLPRDVDGRVPPSLTLVFHPKD